MVIAVGMLHYFCKYLHRQGHTTPLLTLLFMPILTFTSVSLATVLLYIEPGGGVMRCMVQ